MNLAKIVKDQIIRFFLGSDAVPKGLSELHHYFRSYGPINFRSEIQEDGSVVLISENFRYGSIITRVEKQQNPDDKITDAILTAFEVPSSYAGEAGVRRIGGKEYAFA